MMAQSTTPASGNNVASSNVSGGNNNASGFSGSGSSEVIDGEGSEAIDLPPADAGC
jgi:hypothetical protein